MEVSRTITCASFWDALVLAAILEEQGVPVRRPDEDAPLSMMASGALDGIKAAVAQLRHEFPNFGPVMIEGEDPDDGAPAPSRHPPAPEPSPAPEPTRRTPVPEPPSAPTPPSRAPAPEPSRWAPASEPSSPPPVPEPPSAPKRPSRAPAPEPSSPPPVPEPPSAPKRPSRAPAPEPSSPPPVPEPPSAPKRPSRAPAPEPSSPPPVREPPSAPKRPSRAPAPEPSRWAAASEPSSPRPVPEPPSAPERLRGAAAPGPSGGPTAAEPSWGAVLATTVRLWAQRQRVRWRATQTRWRLAIMAALTAVVFVTGGVIVELSASGQGKPTASGPGGGTAGGAGALAAAEAARQQAAAWVASQASPDAIVACDPAMCAALQAGGVPASRLLVLTPAGADPLGSDLVVATPAIRGQFGARLAGVYAPVTLAAFGSGATRIDVRVVAPDGAGAYRAQLAADLRARRAAGATLLHNHGIQVAGAARAALAGGEVDPRLLVTLAALSHLHPVEIVKFGGSGPGASAGVPLRSADIAGAVPPGGGRPASPASLRAFFRAQWPPYLPPSLETIRITPRRTVLRVEYRVPCPLGLLGTRS